MSTITDLRGVSDPLYAWLQTSSHTDREHVAVLASACTHDLTELDAHAEAVPPQAYRCRIFVGPIGEESSYWDLQKAYFAARKQDGWGKTQANHPLLGASWTPRAPQQFRLASRRLADAVDANIYAEIAAEERKGALPVVLQLLDPADANP